MMQRSNPPTHQQSFQQSGKALPMIILALVALAAGAFASQAFRNSSETTTDKQAQQLAAVQETLKTSQILPLDFKQVQDFELLDVNGNAIDQSVFDDKWSIVFFGYTHCPDICPITLQVMKGVLAKIEEQNTAAPQIVFVSVDPVRDTSEIMKSYIAYFDESFVGITGDLKSVHTLTASLGIVTSFTANDTDPNNYLVDHTASLLLIDPQKRVRAKITPPHEADIIAGDFLAIVDAPS